MLKRILKRLILVVLILAIAFFASNFFWPEWWKKEIVPPLPVSNDCSAVETEIGKYDWDKDLALAIAKAESHCDAKARGDEDLIYQEDGKDWGYSVGVFQVRIFPEREACDTYDVATNVKCAYNVYQDEGWKAWSMYQNGEYKKYQWRTIDKSF